MIKLYNKHQVHSEWIELTPQEYLGIIPILLKFVAGEIPLGEARVLIFCMLGGINPDKIRRDDWLLFCENAYQVSIQYKFFYKYVYNDERFKELSAKVQKLLEKQLPEDVKHHEAKLAAKFERHPTLDACFAKNLLPEFKYLGIRHKGYTFEVKGNIPITTITAEQFIDAQSAVDLYANSTPKADKFLDLLVSILYCNGEYSSAVATQQSEVTQFSDTIRQAVYLNYQAILLWLFTRTDYAILWGDKKKGESPSDSKKIQMGLRSTLYSFSKQYGSFDEVKRYDLVTFLDLMLHELTESVKSLSQSGMKKDEILDKTGLSLDVINRIL